MAFDESQYKVVASKKLKIDNGRIRVEAFKFKGGETKIGFRQTLIKKDGEEIPVKLSGMSIETAAKVFRLGRKLLAELED
jgi:hypothetical protein